MESVRLTAFLVAFLAVGNVFMNPVDEERELGKITSPLNIDISSLDYLRRYGYYEPADPRLGRLESEDNIRHALSQLQRFGNIPETGVMDEATKKLLETPRCGMADFGPSDKARRKRRFTLQGTAWKKTDLTWRLVNLNNDGLTRSQVEATLELAFSKWQSVTNLNFQKVDSHKADILVSFAEGYHSDAYPFDGPGGTLAHAFYPHTNEGLSGDIHFDDAEHFTLGSPQGKNLLWVAVHEIGHSIGLEHSNIPDAIMYPWYRGYQGNDFPLSQDDIIGIQNIYGSRQLRKTNPPTEARQTKEPVFAHPSTQLPPSQCVSTFTAILYDKPSTKSYVINDGKIYVLGPSLGVERGPIDLQAIFPGIKNADAAYTRGDGRIVLFDDTRFFVVESMRDRRVIQSGSIFARFRGLKSDIKKIDAAFVWLRNGRTYLFSGSDYYRFDESRQVMDYGYPKKIAHAWKGVPDHVDAVFMWRNDVTYFFKGEDYYRMDDDKIEVASGYPMKIAPAWSKCTRVSAGQSKSAANSIFFSSPSLTLLIGLALIKQFL